MFGNGRWQWEGDDDDSSFLALLHSYWNITILDLGPFPSCLLSLDSLHVSTVFFSFTGCKVVLLFLIFTPPQCLLATVTWSCLHGWVPVAICHLKYLVTHCSPLSACSLPLVLNEFTGHSNCLAICRLLKPRRFTIPCTLFSLTNSTCLQLRVVWVIGAPYCLPVASGLSTGVWFHRMLTANPVLLLVQSAAKTWTSTPSHFSSPSNSPLQW